MRPPAFLMQRSCKPPLAMSILKCTAAATFAEVQAIAKGPWAVPRVRPEPATAAAAAAATAAFPTQTLALP